MGEVLATVATTTVMIVVTALLIGLTIFFLVPVATAGAVSLGFFQSVAAGMLLGVVGSAFK